ncbi:MAG: GYD domain-containing protein [Vicinamibacteraceae bacterium]
MPTYITLLRWTQKGIENVKESPARLDAAKKAFQKAGGKMTQFYMVMGQYDMVAIAEAPDDETASRMVLATAAGGSVQTETLRAFTEDEYRKIVAGLP